jgi:hypothetical protein
MIQICRLAAVTTLVLLSGAVRGQTPVAALFESQCATCHSGASDSRAPGRAALAVKSPKDRLVCLRLGVSRVSTG